MTSEIIKILSEKLDTNLVNDLISTYVNMKSAYLILNYEETQSKSGKFAENVFRLLHHIRTGNKIPEIKDMKKEADQLSQLNSKDLPDSIRLIIPRIVLDFIYLSRSKLGSVHVKPIVPDVIDAKLTMDASNWIIATFLRFCYTGNSNRIESIISDIVQIQTPILQKIDDEIFVNGIFSATEEIMIRLFDKSEGLDRKELGSAMKNCFSSQSITNSIKQLTKSKKIHLRRNKKYILTTPQRHHVALFLQKSREELI